MAKPRSLANILVARNKQDLFIMCKLPNKLVFL